MYTKETLENFTLLQLVAIHNTLTSVPVTRFSDKRSAVRRILALQNYTTPPTRDVTPVVRQAAGSRTERGQKVLRSAIIEKHPNRVPYKRPGSKGWFQWDVIPDEPTEAGVLMDLGAVNRELWWSYHLGYLSIDGVLWEDTADCTPLAIARWKRKDLYHRLPDGFVFTMRHGVERWILNEEKTKFRRIRPMS